MNAFKWHSFPILYFIAPFRAFLDGKVIVALLGAFCFMGMIVIVYKYLRDSGLPILLAVSFCFLVSAHPAWSLSVFGQFYPDRLFLVFGLFYALSMLTYLQTGIQRPWRLIVPGGFAAICNERAAIMICFFTLSCLLLHRGARYHRKDILPVCIAMLCAIYALLYMVYVQQNESYSSFLPLTSMRQALISGLGDAGIKFLFTNFVGLGCIAFLNWRVALIAFGSMAPNIFGSIGGAEKTGWMTHYHTLYFTYLVAAAATGLVSLNRRFSSLKISTYTGATIVCLGLFLILNDAYSTKPLTSISIDHLKTYAPAKAISLVTKTKERENAINLNLYLSSIADLIPPGCTVSAVEQMMPTLYDVELNRMIYYYPMGLDGVDYLVIPYDTENDGRIRYSGAISYHGAVQQIELNKLLSARIEKQGFTVLAKFPRYPGLRFGIVVLTSK